MFWSNSESVGSTRSTNNRLHEVIFWSAQLRAVAALIQIILLKLSCILKNFELSLWLEAILGLLSVRKIWELIIEGKITQNHCTHWPKSWKEPQNHNLHQIKTKWLNLSVHWVPPLVHILQYGRIISPTQVVLSHSSLVAVEKHNNKNQF